MQMGADVDSTALATFLAVARHGSVTAAAMELHTVQSNVTARVRQLEGELGVELFARHSRGMTLTAAGSLLQGYALRLTALEAEARAAVCDDGAVRGTLRVGSMETTAALRLPEVLSRFHRTYPDVQLDVRTGPTAELLEHLLAGRLDCALVAGPVDHPGLTARAVFLEELVLVFARDSAGVNQRLANGGLTAIVFRQGCSYRQRLEAQFSGRGWLPFRRLEFGTVEGILGCVSADVGVCMLPRSVVERNANREMLRLESFAPEPLLVETMLVRPSGSHVTAALRAFDAALDAVAARSAGARREALGSQDVAVAEGASANRLAADLR